MTEDHPFNNKNFYGATKICGEAMARAFHSAAVKYVACPVRLTDIAIHPDGDYPQKCKASRVCVPIYEVEGNRI